MVPWSVCGALMTVYHIGKHSKRRMIKIVASPSMAHSQLLSLVAAGSRVVTRVLALFSVRLSPTLACGGGLSGTQDRGSARNGPLSNWALDRLRRRVPVQCVLVRPVPLPFSLLAGGALASRRVGSAVLVKGIKSGELP